MRRVPLFLKSAVVCSSATLLVGFVALKAGLLGGTLHGESPEPSTVSDAPADFMPGSKFAPVALPPDGYVLSGGEEGVELTPEQIEQAKLLRIRALRASSSKSSVPAFDPSDLSPEFFEKVAREQELRASSSKSRAPLIEPGDLRFPTKLQSEAPAEEGKAASRPVMLPGSKSAPVFEVPPPTEGKSAVPRTLMPGSKSLAPLIEAPSKAPPKTVPKIAPKTAPQTFSKGSKGKGT